MKKNLKIIPRHVAIVMDGNGRWAKKRGKPRIFGHREGAKNIARIIETAVREKIEVLSLFAFSSENWKRPKLEIKKLMELYVDAFKNQVKKLHEHNIQLRVIGDMSRFSDELQHYIKEAQELTAQNNGLILVAALNYGGRWDILQAVFKISHHVKKGKLRLADINEKVFSVYLMISDLPEPDLFIRTSGVIRISNFFLWQLAYTELYFTEILWPDFNEKAFKKALQIFSQRKRRFGGL